MRIESSVTSVTWIPSEAISGMPKLPFELGVTHYDEPLPDRIDDLEELRRRDAFREANELRAWIDVEDGKIVDSGYSGGGHIGVTRLKIGPRELAFAAVKYPVIQHEPEVRDGSVRFVQSAGGHMGLPAPRRVRGKPFFRIRSASAWTTLGLTIDTEGRSQHEVVGASPFPRHWIYDKDGKLVEKTGTIDFKKWYREAHGANTPWGDEDSPAFVTAVESELERELSSSIMRSGSKLERRKLGEDEALVEQGDEGDELFLLLDGVLLVVVDGDAVAEVGRGSAAARGGLAALEIDVSARSVAPPERVWALLADASSWTQWADVDEVEVEEGEGLGEVRRMRSGRYRSRERIVAFEPPWLFAYETSGLPMRDYRADVTLTAEDGGTRIRWHSRYRPKYPGTGWLMERRLTTFLGDTAERLARAAEAR
jgi:uncharacterized protein YndB with AHSA1/START domain